MKLSKVCKRGCKLSRDCGMIEYSCVGACSQLKRERLEWKLLLNDIVDKASFALLIAFLIWGYLHAQ